VKAEILRYRLKRLALSFLMDLYVNVAELRSTQTISDLLALHVTSPQLKNKKQSQYTPLFSV
jgi:hypothetical protein